MSTLEEKEILNKAKALTAEQASLMVSQFPIEILTEEINRRCNEMSDQIEAIKRLVAMQSE